MTDRHTDKNSRKVLCCKSIRSKFRNVKINYIFDVPTTYLLVAVTCHSQLVRCSLSVNFNSSYNANLNPRSFLISPVRSRYFVYLKVISFLISLPLSDILSPSPFFQPVISPPPHPPTQMC
jgi:hypothetical protein